MRSIVIGTNDGANACNAHSRELSCVHRRGGGLPPLKGEQHGDLHRYRVFPVPGKGILDD